MKILFLDVDGVLNTKDSIKELNYIDPQKVKLVAKIVKETECKIVITSAWRNTTDLMEKLKGKLRKEEIDIYDVTTYTNHLVTSRLQEIKFYLQEHAIEKYAILDDEQINLEGFFLVESGLTNKLANKVISYLNENQST